MIASEVKKMNFCDKLQKIRKENNITQEQLADKLNVSRQAVSKWESGTAYPDTEKLIQISKMFKVSLDDLINDNIDTTKINEKKKFNFMEAFNIAFEEIRKVFSMFFSMKFWEKIKFLIEMALVILFVIIVAHIANDIILEILRRIFIFLPVKLFNIVDYLVFTILYIIWLILGVMIFIRVLKIRYLDYYVIISDDTIDKQVIEEPIKELKEKKDTKIVIRDPQHSTNNFFKIVGKAFIFFFKIIALFLLLPAIICFIFGFIALVIDLIYVSNGTSFIGLAIAIIGGIIFAYVIIEFLFKLICDQTLSFKKMFLIFIVSLIFIGLGSGLFLSGLNEFELIDNLSNNTKITKETSMDDDLIFEDIMHLDKNRIVIDNKLDNIKIDFSYTDTCYISIDDNHMYHNDILYHHKFIDIYEDGFKMFKESLENLKAKKIINNSSCTYEIEKVSISSDNLNKLKSNYQKSLD